MSADNAVGGVAVEGVGVVAVAARQGCTIENVLYAVAVGLCRVVVVLSNNIAAVREAVFKRSVLRRASALNSTVDRGFVAGNSQA